MLSRLKVIYSAKKIQPILNNNIVRTSISNKHGVVYQEPHRTSLGILKVLVTVISGLLVGAAISKNIANFLEENDLFVPSDDDDDDD
ncbi:unnamed protein product [Psylliodes chrysocephalus]|uniref:Essential MCU regulator, mitochondrial n=1 Tax=Psylliodes chrysocephalus TaxID=3402493 RepID=A0A9P0CP78_9CUCU|nr:unnamed protein product [Psylliodes chrysocephala]